MKQDSVKKSAVKSGISLTAVASVILIIAGLGVLLFPAVSQWIVQYKLSKQIGQYNKVTEAEKADYSDFWNEAESYNATLAKKADQFFVDENEQSILSDLLSLQGSEMLGYIDIPKINVHLPVYCGTEEQQLQSGAGWWIGSSLPTGGEGTHCVITAHTGLAKAKLFTDIDQLKEGDVFSLTVLDRELYYKVDQIKITEPQDITELLVKDGKDYVTLYTCYPYGVNTHRLLVRGTRAEREDADMAANYQSDNNKLVLILVSLGIVAMIIVTVCFLSLKRYKLTSKKHGKHEIKKKDARK